MWHCDCSGCACDGCPQGDCDAPKFDPEARSTRVFSKKKNAGTWEIVGVSKGGSRRRRGYKVDIPSRRRPRRKIWRVALRRGPQGKPPRATGLPVRRRRPLRRRGRVKRGGVRVGRRRLYPRRSGIVPSLCNVLQEDGDRSPTLQKSSKTVVAASRPAASRRTASRRRRRVAELGRRRLLGHLPGSALRVARLPLPRPDRVARAGVGTPPREYGAELAVAAQVGLFWSGGSRIGPRGRPRRHLLPQAPAPATDKRSPRDREAPRRVARGLKPRTSDGRGALDGRLGRRVWGRSLPHLPRAARLRRRRGGRPRLRSRVPRRVFDALARAPRGESLWGVAAPPWCGLAPPPRCGVAPPPR